MGLGQIPFTAIAEYAKIYEVNDLDDFIYFIRIMDNTFLRLNNDKQSRRNDRAKNKGK